jgi:hypothetical protein
MRTKLLYQKPKKAIPKPRRTAPPAPEPVPLPRPFSCAVRCPACRGESVWSCPVSYLAGPPQPDELKRTRVVFDSKTSTIWHFPQLVPPGHAEAREVSCSSLYRRYGTGMLGVRWCPRCATLETARLNWPDDAYFQATVRRTRVFAVDRADWAGIRAYLAAPNRRELYRTGRAPWCVRYLPASVIAARNRDAFIRAMDAVLVG